MQLRDADDEKIMTAAAATLAVAWTYVAARRRLVPRELDVEEGGGGGGRRAARLLPRSAPAERRMDAALPERLRDWMASYVEAGFAAGMAALIARHGSVVADVGVGSEVLGDATRPFTADTLLRMYSMTKPLTTVAVLLLAERGQLALDDPISTHLPAMKGQWRVLVAAPAAAGTPPRGFHVGGSAGASAAAAAGGATGEAIVDAAHEPTVRELLSHTSGCSYGFWHATSVDRAYRAQRLELPHQISAHADASAADAGPATLAEFVERFAALRANLTFQPGEGWQYSLATDLLGALVEAVAGVRFGAFLRANVCAPLAMDRTAFHVSATVAETQLAACYTHDVAAGGDGDGGLGAVRLAPCADGAGFVAGAGQHLESGGGGLLGTARDYLRFAQMLLNGGELDGVRILSPSSVAAMSVDQIEAGKAAAGNVGAIMANHVLYGWGFGLGVKCVRARGEAGRAGAGTCGWGGAAGTAFFYDPETRLACVLVTQVRPHSLLGTPRPEFAELIYDCVIDADAALPHSAAAYSGF